MWELWLEYGQLRDFRNGEKRFAISIDEHYEPDECCCTKDKIFQESQQVFWI